VPTSVVGAGQLVGAVRDLLAAAGLPVGLEQAALLEQAAAARLQLSEAEEELRQVGSAGSHHG
jgi:hypothetical protein